MSKDAVNQPVLSPQSASRRLFITESTALLVSSLLPSCGGGGGGSTSTPTLTPTPAPPPTPMISLESVSTTTPAALSPIVVKLMGFDPTKAFTVSFTDPSGALIAQTPIRFQSDGTIVIAAPLILDASTGNTSGFSTTIKITQNNSTVSIAIVVSDIPQLSDLGVSLGAVSRAFYNHQELALGASINAQQAIAGLPQSTVNNAILIANLQAQLRHVIESRNDIDRIVNGNTSSIPIGTAPDGTAISFDANSVALMDRIIAQYLLAYSANGTLIKAAPVVKAHRRPHSKHAEDPFTAELAALPPGVMATILQSINTLTGTVSFLGTKDTQTMDSSTLDKVLSTLSTAATVVTVGATVVAIGAAVVVGAPEIAAAAGAVATYSSLAGALVSSAAMGNDIYNVATNAYTAVTAAPGSAAQTTAINAVGQAGLLLYSDTVTTFLNAEGVGGVNNPSIIGPAATSVFKGIFEPAASDIALASGGLLTSVANLLIPSLFKSDGAEANSSLMPINLNSDFGQVNGTLKISNSQGNILSSLTGVGAGNFGSGTNQFTSMADSGGSYNLVIPIGNSSISYPSMTISAFDPVSDLLLSSSAVDLSNISPNAPVIGPSLSGTCNDTDAGNPDSDDPDCD